MDENFFLSIRICKQTGITPQNFQFLQSLLLAYPSGKVEGTLLDIASKTGCSHATAYVHIQSLSKANLVIINKKMRYDKNMSYTVNLKFIDKIINENG
jgi:DNA-binding MarR family transcriptional regulator